MLLHQACLGSGRRFGVALEPREGPGDLQTSDLVLGHWVGHQR